MNLSELAKLSAAPKSPETVVAPQATKPTGESMFSGLKLAGATAGSTPAAVQVSPPSVAPAAGVGFDLDSLANLDLANVASDRSVESEAKDEADKFEDHSPVERPVRELPPDLKPEQLGFVKLLDSVYDMHHDPVMIKSAVAKIMYDMQETPYLADLVMDNDVTLVISKMRAILGFRKVKEVKAKAKRASGGGRQSKAAAAKTEFENLLADFL